MENVAGEEGSSAHHFDRRDGFKNLTPAPTTHGRIRERKSVSLGFLSFNLRVILIQFSSLEK